MLEAVAASQHDITFIATEECLGFQKRRIPMLIQIVSLVHYIKLALNRIRDSYLKAYQKHQELFGQYPRE